MDPRNSLEKALSYLPGIFFLFSVGVVAKWIGEMVPQISYLIFAIAFGLLISNLVGLPSLFEFGINNTYKIWLETGIVILGGRVVASRILNIGPKLFLAVFFFLVLSLLLTEYLAKKFKLKDKLGSLLAVGASLCGVSAIIATSGGIKAKERHIAYAVGTVLFFDAITVFSYPFIGKIFSIPSQTYGVWTGISMFSTGTAVAAGFSLTEAAGKFATITKMTRNVFIGAAALVYSLYYLNKSKEKENRFKNKISYLWKKFPKFIFGFIIAMALASLGFFSKQQIANLKNTYHWLFMMAFVGMGYNLELKELKKSGIKPIIVVSITFIIISSASLLTSYLLFN